tara:strand:- start:45 stop:248 length:204 start_codon:yes stop_codon:yes gene_type:complete
MLLKNIIKLLKKNKTNLSETINEVTAVIKNNDQYLIVQRNRNKSLGLKCGKSTYFSCFFLLIGILRI